MEATVSHRRDRVKVRLWRVLEASAEGRGIFALLALFAVFFAGRIVGWW